MSDGQPDLPPGTAADDGIARPDRVGDRLRRAREAQGLTLAEVAERTRVPLRHLEAIEATDFTALPSPTYAVGFARAYARALAVDEVGVAHDVRAELLHVERAPEYQPYETADPARVPSRGLAIFGLGLTLAIVVLMGLWYGTDLLRGGGGSGAMTAQVPAAAPPVTVTPPRAAPSPSTPRQVTLTAGANEVWLRVYDADNTTLYLGTLAPGAKFDVPPTANRPMINVGRPDQLQVSVDGRVVPPLGDGRRAIKDVPVDAAAIAARLTGQPVATPSATPSATPPATPAAAASPIAPTTTSTTTATPRRPAPAPARPRLTETQRANLAAARPASAATPDTGPSANPSE